MSLDLDDMRAENEAVWRRDTLLPDYDRRVVDSTSRYLPALEAEVDRLRAEVDELRHVTAVSPFRVDL